MNKFIILGLSDLGVNAQESINPTNPLDIDSDNNHIIDGFVANKTETDTDGDGLSNEWEAYFKTDPSGVRGMDSDGDIYPDGWEVNNGLNPSIYGPKDKLIPELIHLGYNPHNYICMKFYGVARDMTGHFRKNMDLGIGATPTFPLLYPCGSEAFTNGVGLGYEGLEPITDSAPNIYPVKDTYPSWGRYFRVNIVINQCTELQPCLSQRDSMAYVAIPQGSKLIKSKSSDPPAGQMVSVLSGSTLCAKVINLSGGQWLGEPNKLVAFKVQPLQGSSLPPGYVNATLSARATMVAENKPVFEYPIRFPFIGDDPDTNNALDGMTVKTNEAGLACARFFTGNIEQFNYHIKAYWGGLSVGWTITTGDAPVTINILPDYRYWPEYAAPNTDIPLHVYVKNYVSVGCNQENKCAYRLVPFAWAPVVWRKKINTGPWEEIATTVTDSRGIAEHTYYFNQTSGVVYIEAFTWGYSGTVAEIKPRLNTRIRMAKQGSGTWPDLAQGGTVASSMLGIGDGAIKVTIENKPTYFGVSKLFEYPADGSTVPEGFKDAELSAKATWVNVESPRYEAPIKYIFLGDDRDDMKEKLTVKTNEYGKACVAYYTGNTDNFAYKIRAQYGKSKLEWEVKTSAVILPYVIVTDFMKDLQYSIIGDDLPVGIQIKNYNVLTRQCKGIKCAYNITPVVGETVTWKYQLNNGTATYFSESATDAKGRAGITYTAGQPPVTSPSDSLSFWAYSAYNALGLRYNIMYFIPEANVKIKMEKIGITGAVSALPEGGMLASSFLGLSDLGVRMSIENAPSNFMSAFSIPMGNISQDMLIDPKPEFKENGRSVIFPRGEKSYYYFKLTPNAPAGAFRIILAEAEPYGAGTLDETTAHIANDYLEMSCLDRTNGKCTGYLHWLDPLGNSVNKWEAVSGWNIAHPALPPLPDSTCPQNVNITNYVAKSYKPRFEDEAGGGFCDPGPGPMGVKMCWTVNLIPDPIFDCGANRNRGNLRIHPLPSSGVTLGCIGVRNSSYDFRRNILEHLETIGDMSLTVH